MIKEVSKIETSFSQAQNDFKGDQISKNSIRITHNWPRTDVTLKIWLRSIILPEKKNSSQQKLYNKDQH